MALPNYLGKGAFASGPAALSVAWPTGGVYTTGDYALLCVESANQAIAAPSGWAELTGSPQGTGTAAAAGGVRLAVFGKFAASASEADVSVADTGNHTTAIITVYRGVDSTTPVHITAGSVQAATTAMSWPSVTTTLNDCLIVLACAQDTDAASTATCAGYTNAALGSLTEVHDQTVTSGAGGGLVIATGTKATAGATGATTATGSTSVTHAYLTIALAPAAVFNGTVAAEASATAASTAAGTQTYSGSAAAAASAGALSGPAGVQTYSASVAAAASDAVLSAPAGAQTSVGAVAAAASASALSTPAGSGAVDGVVVAAASTSAASAPAGTQTYAGAAAPASSAAAVSTPTATQAYDGASAAAQSVTALSAPAASVVAAGAAAAT
ncbi:MAG: hypothetical protein ACSLE9_11045, partial [Burkholderiaceae bacterium]